MNLIYVERITVTTDVEAVNALLDKGWVLLEVVATFKKEYSFLLGLFNENRKIILRAVRPLALAMGI